MKTERLNRLNELINMLHHTWKQHAPSYEFSTETVSVFVSLQQHEMPAVCFASDVITPVPCRAQSADEMPFKEFKSVVFPGRKRLDSLWLLFLKRTLTKQRSSDGLWCNCAERKTRRGFKPKAVKYL